MRIIKGFICVAAMDKTEVLFGKNMGRGQFHYENFCSNDMTPFTNIFEAKVAQAELQKRSDFDSIYLAGICIGLAETMEEIYSLEKKRRLIVVRKTSEFKEVILIGPCTQEALERYPLYGALLEENGLKPFTSFGPAQYTAGEEHRQTGGCPVFIATFRFKKIQLEEAAKNKRR
jgi:hypothetical protein